MQITITARHMETPPLLEEMLRAKVGKLERMGHKLNGLHAIFGKDRYLYTAELTLTAKGFAVVGRAAHPKDLLTCMEEALAKVEQQLRRREDKRIEELRRRAPHRPA
ncbi:MAG: ribosome-associated translation inhibitor RaiA [Candidatus Omnitrophica bacterium]|nr:ribosome-associated translation inhibitor RaiA [Candidatus Omnitrophota bacterium]